MTIHAGAFGMEEEEGSDWSINDEGQLEPGDTEKISYDEPVWLRDGDCLQPFECKRTGLLVRENAICLKRVD